MKNLKSKLFLSNGNHGDGYEISVEEQNSLDKSRIKTNLETWLAESRQPAFCWFCGRWPANNLILGVVWEHFQVSYSNIGALYG